MIALICCALGCRLDVLLFMWVYGFHERAGINFITSDLLLASGFIWMCDFTVVNVRRLISGC